MNVFVEMDWRDSVLPKRKRAPYRIISVMLSRNVRNGCPVSITGRCSEREPEIFKGRNVDQAWESDGFRANPEG